MKKLLIILAILLSGISLMAQSWTTVSGRYRYPTGFGIPVKDSSFYNLTTDTSFIYINPTDGQLYWKYKTYHYKVSSGNFIQFSDTSTYGIHSYNYNKAQFDALYVPPTRTVAGFALSSNITLADHSVGYGISGSAYNGSTARTWVVDSATIFANFLSRNNSFSGNNNFANRPTILGSGLIAASDTSAMLTNYVRAANAPLSVSSHFLILDTTTLSGGWHSYNYNKGQFDALYQAKYWQRSGTTISPVNSGDAVSLDGNLNIGQIGLDYATGVSKTKRLRLIQNSGSPTIYTELVSSATAARTITFPDSDGDIPVTNSGSLVLPANLTAVKGTFTDGSQGLIVRSLTSGGGFGAIYPSTVTPSASNYAFAASSTATIIANPTSVVLATGAGPTAGVTINATQQVSLSSLGTGTVYSNSGTLTNTNPSDSTLKNTIKPLSYGLKEILLLKPKSYYYNDDSSYERLQYGFIAQDVQKVLPELVRPLSTNPKEKMFGKYGLEQNGIYVTMVKAIQELNSKVESCEAKIAEQQKDIDELKAAVKALQNK